MNILLHKQTFDAKSSDATIKLYGLAPQMNQLIATIINPFQQQAPKMTLDIDTLPKPHFAGLLEGDVHFVVTASPS